MTKLLSCRSSIAFSVDATSDWSVDICVVDCDICFCRFATCCWIWFWIMRSMVSTRSSLRASPIVMASAATAYPTMPSPSTSNAHDPSNPTHLGIRGLLVDVNVRLALVNSRPDRGQRVFRDHVRPGLRAFQRRVFAGRCVDDVPVRHREDVFAEAVL